MAVHTGINYTVSFPIRNDQPVQVDQVACDFPDLVIIACHAGWPWVPEMVAVMRKHPHVYAEFGGLAPRYVCEAGTGWEVMFRFMNSLLGEQVLHGTDWPVFPMSAPWRSGGVGASGRESSRPCSAGTPPASSAVDRRPAQRAAVGPHC